MTKIALKSESIAITDLFLKALIVLPENALITFNPSEGVLEVADEYSNSALAHLINAGIQVEVISMERDEE